MIRKDWVELPPDSEGYKDGVDYFLDIAYSKGIVEGIEILCPCVVCCNDSWEERDVVYDHLCSKGFVKGYLEWIYHGEDNILMDLDSSSDDETSSDDQTSYDDIDGLLFETFKALMQQCNPQLNMESIEDLLGLSHGDAKESGPQMHSSTSTHAPDHGEQGINEDDKEDDGVSDEEDGGVNDDSQEDDESDDDGLSVEFQEDDISDEEDDEDDEFDELK